MYPSLVNCTTIDLFGDWPQDALLEVGERYLSQIELAGDDKVNHSLLFCFSMSKIRIKQQKKTINYLFQFATVREVILFSHCCSRFTVSQVVHRLSFCFLFCA